MMTAAFAVTVMTDGGIIDIVYIVKAKSRFTKVVLYTPIWFVVVLFGSVSGTSCNWYLL